MGQKKLVIILVSFILASLALANQASADWHVGNRRFSAYGVKANIWAPSTPVNIVASGISNSVTLTKPYWVQTGWRYYVGYSVPQGYVEYCKPPCQQQSDYFVNNFVDHNWGSVHEYKVDHSAASSWCIYIDGVMWVTCQSIRAAPTEVIVQSEVHENFYNGLDTNFTNVYYRTSNNQWLVFDQANWFEDPPYYVHKEPPYTTYYFRTYRGSMIFLPIAIN